MDIRVRRGEKVESLGRPISVYRGGKKKETFQQQNIYQFMIDLDFCLIDSETSKTRNLEARTDKRGPREFPYL